MSRGYLCVVCLRQFADHVQARTVGCKGNAGHSLQELIEGSVNPDDGQQADFRSVDSTDLARWAEQAKKLGYEFE